ncbi:MAG: hypothetical protein IKV26_00565 [Paludibacteraceae bacterium]|nr:hypothetical protein [Paludibacteraceae bacterium]MBR5825323.1 hypothetical protein [Paludibacteraceae bacterium]
MKNIFSIDKSCQNEVVTLQREIGLRLGIIENKFLFCSRLASILQREKYE